MRAEKGAASTRLEGAERAAVVTRARAKAAARAKVKIAERAAALAQARERAARARVEAERLVAHSLDRFNAALWAIWDRCPAQAILPADGQPQLWDRLLAPPADRYASANAHVGVFRFKDLRSWWSNPHRNRSGGVESGSATAWVPESKPIRFTEMGCPAVDRGPNQPNVFYDPKSAESFLPYFSRGWRDDAVQRRFLEAALGYWAEPANNPVSGVYGGRMIATAETAVDLGRAAVPGLPGAQRRLDRRRQLAARPLAERPPRLGLAREPRPRALPPRRAARQPDRRLRARRRRPRLLCHRDREPARLDRALGAALRLRRGRERGRRPLPAARPPAGGDPRPR